MSSCDNSNIRKNYIVSGSEQDILSACTGFYTNDIYPCTGDTIIVHSDILSANTINSSVFLSGGTNLLDIFGYGRLGLVNLSSGLILNFMIWLLANGACKSVK